MMLGLFRASNDVLLREIGFGASLKLDASFTRRSHFQRDQVVTLDCRLKLVNLAGPLWKVTDLPNGCSTAVMAPLGRDL